VVGSGFLVDAARLVLDFGKAEDDAADNVGSPATGTGERPMSVVDEDGRSIGLVGEVGIR
jgi:hypothetical protein